MPTVIVHRVKKYMPGTQLLDTEMDNAGTSLY
jgi:hypothetical protein